MPDISTSTADRIRGNNFKLLCKAPKTVFNTLAAPQLRCLLETEIKGKIRKLHQTVLVKSFQHVSLTQSSVGC